MTEEQPVSAMGGQECPFCREKTLTLSEQEREIAYFGKVYLFSMSCSSCKYHKSDVECADHHDPARYTLEVTSAEDMSIRIVKSSEATVKIAHIGSIEPGEAANGYISNVEGILQRMKHAIEIAKETAEDDDEANKARNLIKKINRVVFGDEKIKIVIEDPTGNSAIISEKAIKEPMKGKKSKD